MSTVTAATGWGRALGVPAVPGVREAPAPAPVTVTAAVTAVAPSMNEAEAEARPERSPAP